MLGAMLVKHDACQARCWGTKLPGGGWSPGILPRPAFLSQNYLLPEKPILFRLNPAIVNTKPRRPIKGS
jgi:hypothetical protein